MMRINWRSASSSEGSRLFPTCVAVFVSLFVQATYVLPQDFGSIDLRLFRYINDTQDPQENGCFEHLDLSSIPSFASIPTSFYLVGTITRDREAQTTGVIVGASQLFSFGSTTLLKALVGRSRPFETLPDVKAKHLWSAIGSSFPSGHTAQAFAIATALALRYPKFHVIVPAALWAGLIGYGRIYLGVHYPTDILGGLIVGVGSAVLVWQVRGDLERIAGRVLASPNGSISGHYGYKVSRGEFYRVEFPLN